VDVIVQKKTNKTQSHDKIREGKWRPHTDLCFKFLFCKDAWHHKLTTL